MHRYEQIAQIGKGSFGVVYKCRLKHTGQFVAVKQISTYGKSSSDLTALRSEISLLKEINHPNTIRFFESFEEDGNVVIVTELAQSDLYNIALSDGPFNIELIQRICFQLLNVLDYLHSRRIAHRDIKSQNVLISQGICKLCDFGFARQMSQQTLALQSIKGTPLYLAPEIAKGKKYNVISDIWAFGVMMFELATGRTPFIANDFVTLMNILQDDSNKVPYEKFPVFAQNSVFKSFCECALQRIPDKRWSSHQLLEHPFLNEGSAIRLTKHVSNAYTFKDWFALLRVMKQQSALQSILMTINTEAVVETAEKTEMGEKEYADSFYDNRLVDHINEAMNSITDLPPIIIAFMALLSINSNQAEAIFTSEVVTTQIHSAGSQNLEKDYYRILAYIHAHPADKDGAFYRVADFMSFLIVRSSSLFLQLIQSAMHKIAKTSYVYTDVISIVLLLRVSAVCFGCMFTWNVPTSFGQLVAFPYDMYITAESVVFPSRAEDKPRLTKRAHILAAAINTLSAMGMIEKLFESFNTMISKSTSIVETSTDSFIIKCLLYTINVSFCLATMAQTSVQFLMQEYVLYLPSGNRMIGLEHLLAEDYVEGDPDGDTGEGKKGQGAELKLRTIDIRYDVNIRNSLFGQIDTRDYNKFRFLPKYFEKFTTSENATENSANLFGEDEYSYVGIFLNENFKGYVNRFVDLISSRCARDYTNLLTRLYVIFKRLINFKNGIKLDEGYITIYNNYITTCLQTLFQSGENTSQSESNSVMQAAMATIIKNLNLPILSADSTSSGVLKYAIPSIGQTIGKTGIGDLAAPYSKANAVTPREGRDGLDESQGRMGNRLSMDLFRSTAMNATANMGAMNQSMSVHSTHAVSALCPTVEFALILLHLRQTLLQNHQSIVNMFTVRMPSKILSTRRLTAMYSYFREPYCFNLEIARGTDMSGVTMETYQGSAAVELNSIVMGRNRTEMSILLNSENTFLVDYLNAFKKQLAMCYCFLPFAYIQSDEMEVVKQLNSAGEEFRRIFAEKAFVETQLNKKFYHGSVVDIQAKGPTDAAAIDATFNKFTKTVMTEIKSLKFNSFKFLKNVFAPSFQYLFPLYTYSHKDPSPLAQHALYLKRRFQQLGIPNGDDITLSDIKNNDIKTLIKMLIQADLPKRGHFIITIPQVCYIFDGMNLPNNPFSLQISNDPFSTFSLYQTNVNLVSTYMLLSDCIRMVVEEAFLNGLLTRTNENDTSVCQISNVVVQKYVDIHVIFATSKDDTIPPSDYLYQGLPVCAYVKQEEIGSDKIVIDKNAQIDYLDKEDIRVNALLTLYNCAFCSDEYAKRLCQITFSISDIITENKDETKLSFITILAISCLWLQAHGEEDDLRLSLFGLLLTCSFEFAMTCLNRDSDYLVRLYKPDSLSTIKDLVLLSLVKRMRVFANSVEESLAEAKLIMDGSSFKRIDDTFTNTKNDPVLNPNPHDFNILSHGVLRVERIMKEMIKAGGIIDYGYSDFDGGFDRYNYPKIENNVQINVRQLRRLYYYLSTGTAIEVPSVNNYLELEVPVPVFYACIDAIGPILKHCKEVAATAAQKSTIHTVLPDETRDKIVKYCLSMTRALFESLDYVLVEPSFRAFLIPCHNYTGFLDSALLFVHMFTCDTPDVIPLFVKLSVYLNLSFYNSIEAAFCAIYMAPHHGAILSQCEFDPTADPAGTYLTNMSQSPSTEDSKTTPKRSLSRTSLLGTPTPQVSDHDSTEPHAGRSSVTNRSKSAFKATNYTTKQTVVYEPKSETDYPVISTHLSPVSSHHNNILMCNLVNSCGDCLADCLGLDTSRYDLGGLEGRNAEIANANWHWRFLTSPQGLANYVTAVRNVLSLLGDRQMPGLTEPPADVNYNSTVWAETGKLGGHLPTGPSRTKYNISFPLPEVLRILCTAISPQSLDSILLCPSQFGGGQQAAEYLVRNALLAIYQIVYLACRSRNSDNDQKIKELKSAGGSPKKDKLFDVSTLIYDSERYYMTEYVSAVLLEFNFIKNIIDSLYYLKSMHTLYYALVTVVFFVMHPEDMIVISWINQFVFSGGISMNVLSAIFSQKNVNQRNNPHSCILELLIILLKTVQVSPEYAELVNNTVAASTFSQFLSFESSENLIAKSCDFIGYLVKIRPSTCEQYLICLDSLIELVKTRRPVMVTRSLCAITQIAKHTKDFTVLRKVINCVCKTLMNARVLDDIKTCAAVASAQIILVHEELAADFVAGEGVISLADCISSCDSLSDKMIYAKALLELTKMHPIAAATKSQIPMLKLAERDCNDEMFKTMIDTITTASKQA